jgi:predicted PolB exonuclease-like 3'-5' exonuclease
MRDFARRADDGRMPSSVLAYDLETFAPPMPDGSFPPWPTHRIVAVGFARAACVAGEWSFDIGAQVAGCDLDEAGLVLEAERRIGSAEVVTGYNTRQFDSLVLRLAAQRLRLWNLPSIAKHAALPRFDGAHADLADLYSSFGRKVGLADLCETIGSPVKTATSGGDVAALWEAGETERIHTYVMEDAVATVCLYFAWLAGRAGDEALVTRPLAALARHIEATPALASLQPFVDASLTRWARPRAMVAEIAAALDRQTERLRREEGHRAFAP